MAATAWRPIWPEGSDRMSSKETSRITVRDSSRMVASRAASRETRRAVTRTATIRTVRTSSSKDRLRAMTRASRDPLQTSNRVSS